MEAVLITVSSCQIALVYVKWKVTNKGSVQIRDSKHLCRESVFFFFMFLKHRFNRHSPSRIFWIPIMYYWLFSLSRSQSTSHILFLISLLYVLFILCVYHLLVKMSVHHLHAWCWWRLEKGIGISGPWVPWLWATMTVLTIKPRSAASACHLGAIPLTPCATF